MSIKNILIVIAILVMGYFSYQYFFSNTHEKIAEDATIVVVGDSLSSGYGSTKGNDYVTVLSGMIGRPIVNKGVSGDTSEDALKRVDDVIKLKPGLVIVFIGGNDLLRRVNINTTFENIDQIVSKIKESGSEVALVAVPGSILGDPFESRFKAVAKKYDVVYIPQFLSKMFGDKELMFDSVHPNDKGYKIVAEKIYEGIKDLI